jgi:Nucleotidyl transferase AbiEii toxin, Type IV TA system
MKLHLNKKLYKQAIEFTSQQMNIPEIYVEKDYWVTLALHIIFHHEIGKDTVFKGGTALSKCYNLIERFSEDIDLVVLRREGEKDNKLNKKIRQISKVVNETFPEINIEGITHKMGMNRKTAHSYSKEFEGNYGQVRDAIIIEATWLGYFEPYISKKINSYIGNMMIENGQIDIAKENGLLPFNLLVLEPTRTICEKIMSLVRFSNSENPIEDLKRKIRHIYDLHQLLQQKEFLVFFNAEEFDTMLLKVANDDVISYKNNNKWIEKHPVESMIFNQPENIWSELKDTYSNSFKNLVYGNLPNEKDILSTLKKIKTRLTKVNWTIKIK